MTTTVSVQTSTPAGVVAVLAATACWGGTVVVTRVAVRGLDAGPLTLIELTVAVAVLATVMAIARRRPPRLTGRLVLAGVFEPALTFVLINAGVERTSGSHAALLVGTESLFLVAAASVATRTRPPWAVVLGLLLALSGAAALSADGGGSATPLGDLLVVAGAAAGAAFVLTARPLLEVLDPLTLTTCQFAVGWVVTAAVVLPDLALHHTRPTTQTAVIAAVAAGVLGSAIAFGLYNWSLSRISPTLAGTSLTGISVFGTGLSILFLGDDVTAPVVGAGAAVVAGVALTLVAEARTEVEVQVDAVTTVSTGGAPTSPGSKGSS